MEPRRAKEVLSGLPEDLAAQFLAAMKPKKASRIIGMFRTPAEMAKLQRLLDLMRNV